MKKYITLLLILGTFCVSAQDKLSMYGQVTALNFNQFNFNLDARYKLRDYISLSNWSTITQGRTAEQGFDYLNSTTLINFGKKGTESVLSFGHLYMNVPHMKFDQHQFVVKLRFKLL